MLVFDGLPNDALLEVLLCLADDRQSLWSLTVASRRLYLLTLPYLYRHISLHARRTAASKTWFESYIRTISKRPGLALLANALNLTLPKARLTCSLNLQRVNNLLRLLPNVRVLGLQLYGASDAAFLLRYLDTTFMSSLRELKIRNHSVIFYDLFCWKATRNITSLQIEDMKQLQHAIPLVLDSERLFLSSLSFGSTVNLPTKLLRELVQNIPSLTKLVCNVPVLEKGHRLDLKLLLDPSSVAHALEPIQNSLVGLHLRSGAWPNWSKEDRPRMDLSGFNALKILSAPAKCFQPAKHRKDLPKSGLYRTLPVNLADLTIHFDLGSDNLHHWEAAWEEIEAKGQLEISGPTCRKDLVAWREEYDKVHIDDVEIDDAEIEKYVSVEGLALRKDRYPIHSPITAGTKPLWSEPWDPHQWEVSVRLREVPFKLRVLLRKQELIALGSA